MKNPSHNLGFKLKQIFSEAEEAREETQTKLTEVDLFQSTEKVKSVKVAEDKSCGDKAAKVKEFVKESDADVSARHHGDTDSDSEPSLQNVGDSKEAEWRQSSASESDSKVKQDARKRRKLSVEKEKVKEYEVDEDDPVIMQIQEIDEHVKEFDMFASEGNMMTEKEKKRNEAGPSKVTSVMSSSSTSKPQKTNSFKQSSVFDDVEDDPFIVQIQERQRKKEEKNKRERQRRRDRKSSASIAKMIQSSQPVSLKKEGGYQEAFKTFSGTSQGDEEEDFKEAKKSSQRDRKGGQRKGNQGVQKIDKFMKKEGKRKGREEEDCLPSIDELLAMPERNEDGKTMDEILDEVDAEIAKRQEKHKKEMEKVKRDIELQEQERRDREARYVVNAGHRDRLAAEITQPVLRRMFDDNLEFLKSIRDGRTESSRHTAFHKNPMTRQALLYTMITHPFTDAQVDWTLECMTEVWMKTRKEQADNNEYIWKVLMSECLTKFYGDYFKISKIEALRRIKETPFEDEDD